MAEIHDNIDGQHLNLLEAIKAHPTWAETRIRFLEHALYLMQDTITTCLLAIQNVDDVEFKPSKREEKTWAG